MDRESSPTNHISAAPRQRAFDPLAFGGAAGGQASAPSSSSRDYHQRSDGATSSANGAAAVPRRPEHMDVDSTEDPQQATPRARGRPKQREEIPPVTDETGERVRETFREFLTR